MSFSKSRVARFNTSKSVLNPASPRTVSSLIPGDATMKGKKYGDMHMQRNISQSSNLSGSSQNVRSRSAEGVPKTKIPVNRFGGKHIPKKKVADSDSVKSDRSTVDISQDSSRSNPVKNSGIPIKRNVLRNSRISKPRARVIENPPMTLDSPKKTNITPATLEIQYQSKLTRMINLKNDILNRQKPLVELYKILQNMRDRIKEIEGKEMPLEELKIIDCYTHQERMEMLHGDSDPEKFKLIKAKLTSVSDLFMILCRKICQDKLNIIDKVFNEEGEWDQDLLMAKIQQYKVETASLEEVIEGRLKEEEQRLFELMKELQQSLPSDPKDHMKIQQDLEKKLEENEHKLKLAVQDLNFERAKKAKELEKIREMEKEIDKLKDRLIEYAKHLEEEKARVVNYRERHNQLEQKVKSAKGKIREVETERKDTEGQVDNLNQVIKKLEEQWRSKEIYFENRQKEMQKIVKTHESNVQQMEEERRTVDVRIDAIREDFHKKEKVFQHKIDDWKNVVHEEEDRLEKLIQEKEELQQQYDFLKAQTDKVEIVGHHFFKLYKNVQLANNALGEDPAAVQVKKTDEEVTLWAELEETKSALRDAENKLMVYGEEKSRFLDTITQNHVDDNDITEITVQLLGKEEQITNLHLDNKELQNALYMSQEELQTQQVMILNLQKQIAGMHTNLSQEIGENEKMAELRRNWEEELTRSSELELKLVRLEHKHNCTESMLDERDGLLKIRDSLINMIQERNSLSASQNENFRKYLKSVLEEKDDEVENLRKEIFQKTQTINELEAKKAVLEMTYKDTINKRVQLHTKIGEMEEELSGAKEEIERLRIFNESKSICSADPSDLQAKSSHTKIREDQQKFLEHAKKISYHDTKLTKNRSPSNKSVNDFNKNKNKNTAGSSMSKKQSPSKDIDKLFIVNSLAPCFYSVKHDENTEEDFLCTSNVTYNP